MLELTKRSLEASPDNKDFRYELQTIRQVLLPTADRTTLMMRAGALLLVFLAVSNLASLLIAWGFERKQEMSVRLALGAHNSRIVRMLVLQSVAVVLLGGILGVAITAAALPALRSLDVTPTLALFFVHLKLDARVLLAGALAVAVSGIAAGVVPAWFAARTELAESLRSASRSASLSVSALRWQKAMVFLQAALSVIIVCAAGLIGVSFRNLARVPDGFSPANRIVARIQLPNPQYGQHPARVAFADRLLANLANERELASFGFTSALPVGDNLFGGRFFLEQSEGSPSSEPLLLHIRRVSPGYIATMKIPLLRGRHFDARDDSAHTGVALVSQATAKRLWPGQDAIGKTFYRVLVNAPAARLEVVGVVGDLMDAGYNVPPGEAVYLPWAQVSVGQMSIVAEPRGAAEAAVRALRKALRGSDPVIAATDATTLDALVRQANALPRLQTILLLSFALVAISMVGLGCYGVMTQLVTSREREFALRMLFGAAPAQLGSTVLLQAGRLTTAGALIGVGAMWLLSGTLRPLVFGVAPRSAVVLAVGSLVVLVLAGIAALPATVRAMRVDARRI
jgi:putative ABC transport system permease protein